MVFIWDMWIPKCCLLDIISLRDLSMCRKYYILLCLILGYSMELQVHTAFVFAIQVYVNLFVYTLLTLFTWVPAIIIAHYVVSFFILELYTAGSLPRYNSVEEDQNTNRYCTAGRDEQGESWTRQWVTLVLRVASYTLYNYDLRSLCDTCPSVCVTQHCHFSLPVSSIIVNLPSWFTSKVPTLVFKLSPIGLR